MEKTHERIIDLTDAAHKIDYRFVIFENLGIDDNDARELFYLFLQQRLYRYDIYETSSILGSFVAVVATRIPLFSPLVRLLDSIDRDMRNSLESIDTEISKLIAEKFTNEGDGNFVRQLELATNDIVLLATHNLDTGLPKKFSLNDKIVKAWSEKWQPKLNEFYEKEAT